MIIQYNNNSYSTKPVDVSHAPYGDNIEDWNCLALVFIQLQARHLQDLESQQHDN